MPLAVCPTRLPGRTACIPLVLRSPQKRASRRTFQWAPAARLRGREVVGTDSRPENPLQGSEKSQNRPGDTTTGPQRRQGRSGNVSAGSAGTSAEAALQRLPTRSGSGVAESRMSGRRPEVKGFVEALRTRRVRSCLRPVDAGWMIPLALMLVRMALRPIKGTRSNGAARLSGFQAESVGSHHFAVALDANRLAAKTRSGRACWFRPRPAGRRNGPLWSRAHRRSARACWRAPLQSA